MLFLSRISHSSRAQCDYCFSYWIMQIFPTFQKILLDSIALKCHILIDKKM